MSPVLVTGASGYLGTRLVAELLGHGTAVRAVLRSPDRETPLRDAVRRGAADTAGLEPIVLGLATDDGWADALSGVEEVYHLASPLIHATDPEQVVGPARDGTLRVLRAARVEAARGASS